LISPERALEILREEGCSLRLIDHAKAVAKKSREIAEKISANGEEIDVELVHVGALLHDIGRSKTHCMDHGVEGGHILRERGLDEFVPFAENHLGAGITKREAEELDLPGKNYIPNSLEEKIVTYSDNLVRGADIQTYEEALQELREEVGPDHPATDRFRKLHDEIKRSGGVI